MSKLILNSKFQFRMEELDGDKVIFCYDERIDKYFVMDAKYYNSLILLQNGIDKDAFFQQSNIDSDLLVRGLMYRSLLFEETCMDS